MADDLTLKLLLLGEDRSASKALGGVGKAAGVALAVAGAAAVKFAGDSVSAFLDADKSQRQLQDAYDRFPALADVSIAKQRELNQAIQDKTGADADDIAASQAVLARHKLTGEQIAQMTPLLVDYAKRTGQDLPAAGDKLGKALAGNARAMKELGIPFKDAKDSGKNFEQVISGLQEKVGGFAEKEAGTLEGRMERLNTKFGDVQEQVGAALVPVLEKLADVAMVVVDYVQENADWLGPLAVALGVATAAVWLLNAAMSANPIGLVVLAIAALVAGLVWAYNESETFRKVVDTAFEAVGEAGRWLWNNALQPVIQFIVRGFAFIVRGIASMLDALGNIPGFEWARDAARKMRGAADEADKVADNIRKIPPRKNVDVNIDVRKTGIRQVDAVPIKGGGGWKISAYDKGGRPRVGELALFHADELWVPDHPGTVLTRSQTRAAIGSGPQALGGASVIYHTEVTYDIDMSGLIDSSDGGRRIAAMLDQHKRDLNNRPLQFERT